MEGDEDFAATALRDYNVIANAGHGGCVALLAHALQQASVRLVARLAAVNRGANSVSAALLAAVDNQLFYPIGTEDSLSAALLAYALSERVRPVLQIPTLAAAAANGDELARTAMAYVLSDASLLPFQLPSYDAELDKAFEDELVLIQRTRERWLHRETDNNGIDDVSKLEKKSDGIDDNRIHAKEPGIRPGRDEGSSQRRRHRAHRLAHVQVYDAALTVRLPKVFTIQSSQSFLLPLTQRNTDVWVVTPRLIPTLRDVCAALSAGIAVMLEGPSGCGKTELINHIASLAYQQDNLVRVHMDSSASGADEFADIIGAVVPRAHAQGFCWRAGAVGLALLRGGWVVLEGLSSDGSSSCSASIAALASMCGGSGTQAMHVRGRGEPLFAAPGFTLLATRTVDPRIVDTVMPEQNAKDDTQSLAQHGDTMKPPGGWQLWRRITLPPLDEDHMKTVLSMRFPDVATVVPRVVRAVQLVAHELTRSSARSAAPRVPTMRDAVKICNRLGTYSRVSAELALADTIDVLCAAEMDELLRKKAVCAACDAWSVLPSVGETLDSASKPQVDPGTSHETAEESNNSAAALQVGRAHLLKGEHSLNTRPLAETGESARLLERLARAVQMQEPVLLTGETGVGKTASVQELARLSKRKLVVLNMSRQSDVSDLLGGYRPIDEAQRMSHAVQRFDEAFSRSLSRRKNAAFLMELRRAVARSDSRRASALMRGVLTALPQSRRASSPSTLALWREVEDALDDIDEYQMNGGSHPMSEAYSDNVDEQNEHLPLRPSKKRRRRHSIDGNHSSRATLRFEFVEGALANAMRTGAWVLLDELNLAPSETLERLVGLLDDRRLPQSADTEIYDSDEEKPAGASADDAVQHSVKGFSRLDHDGMLQAAPGFAILAAMNPPTDVGRRTLPAAIHARFTTIHVGDNLPKDSLVTLVRSRLNALDRFEDGYGKVTETSDDRATQLERVCSDVADFYVQAHNLVRREAITDAAGMRPRFSLRALSRMLDFAVGVLPSLYTSCAAQLASLPITLTSFLPVTRRALYEGAVLAFASSLPQASRPSLLELAKTLLISPISSYASGTTSDATAFAKTVKVILSAPLASLQHTATPAHVRVGGFWLRQGTLPSIDPDVQAQTSGSESFVLTPSVTRTLDDVARALASGAPRLPVLLQGPTAAGKTSLVSYLARCTGHRLTRINNNEHTDVAEYLGGYVVDADGSLSFREGPLVHAARHGEWLVLDELNLAPAEVLEALNRLLDDNRELRLGDQVVRAHEDFAIFATQNPPGAYAGRKALSRAFRARFVELLVDELPQDELRTIVAQRARVPESFSARMVAVLHALQAQRRLSGVFHGRYGFVTSRDLFRWAARDAHTREELLANGIFVLAERSRRDEERLFVCRTIRTQIMGRSVDFERAVTSRQGENGADGALKGQIEEQHVAQLYERVWQLDAIQSAARRHGVARTNSMRRMVALLWHCVENVEPALLVGETGCGKTTACQLVADARKAQLYGVNLHRNSDISDLLGSFRPRRQQRRSSSAAGDLQSKQEADSYTPPFEWRDGPVVVAMKSGDCLLLDEINTAEHAVTERLNSLLEPSRTLLLSEKGGSGSDVESFVAAPNFRVFATMNPGGDFGKKELSTALRNRFTEIWVPATHAAEDYAEVVRVRLRASLRCDLIPVQLEDAANAICRFAQWTLETSNVSLSLRDVATWADFVATVTTTKSACSILMSAMVAYAHGARLVLFDGHGTGLAMRGSFRDERTAAHAWQAVLAAVPVENQLRERAALAPYACSVQPRPTLSFERDAIVVGDYRICCANGTAPAPVQYSLSAPTTTCNCTRVARAMVLPRAVLLEGSPGVGKTTLVEALAETTSHLLLRVNLSEHTEMSDLVGCELPVAGAGVGQFLFQEGALLRCMKAGGWLLLDELNLASQSVLEGLNSVLDHRRSVFVPELQETVHAAEGFRVFGAQNPAAEGGGRRRLPRSFLNRFTRVKLDTHNDEDLQHIASAAHSSLARDDIERIVRLFGLLRAEGVVFGGEMMSFNVRDVLRWCALMEREKMSADAVFDVLVLQRLGSCSPSVGMGLSELEEQHRVALLAFEKAFERPARVQPSPLLRITERTVRVGEVRLPRGDFLSGEAFAVGDSLPSPQVIGSQLRPLQALAAAVASGWTVALSASDGAGKHTLVRLLAALCGQRLLCVDLGSSVDTSDLLGAFEQTDARKCLQRAVVRARQAADAAVASHIRHSVSEAAFELESRCTECEHQLRCVEADHLDDCEAVLSKLFDVHRLCAATLEPVHCLETQRRVQTCKFLHDALLYAAQVLTAQKRSLQIGEEAKTSTIFEWQNGQLIEAAARGEWVYIPHASSVPNGVLDRLNPLLERAGAETIIAEAPADADGSPRMFRASPLFRLFLGTEPHGAPLSRALRNRSVEVFLPPHTSPVSPHANILSALTARTNALVAQPAVMLYSCALPGRPWYAAHLLAALDAKLPRDRAGRVTVRPPARAVQRMSTLSRLMLLLPPSNGQTGRNNDHNAPPTTTPERSDQAVVLYALRSAARETLRSCMSLQAIDAAVDAAVIPARRAERAAIKFVAVNRSGARAAVLRGCYAAAVDADAISALLELPTTFALRSVLESDDRRVVDLLEPLVRVFVSSITTIVDGSHAELLGADWTRARLLRHCIVAFAGGVSLVDEGGEEPRGHAQAVQVDARWRFATLRQLAARYDTCIEGEQADALQAAANILSHYARQKSGKRRLESITQDVQAETTRYQSLRVLGTMNRATDLSTHRSADSASLLQRSHALACSCLIDTSTSSVSMRFALVTAEQLMHILRERLRIDHCERDISEQTAFFTVLAATLRCPQWLWTEHSVTLSEEDAFVGWILSADAERELRGIEQLIGVQSMSLEQLRRALFKTHSHFPTPRDAAGVLLERRLAGLALFASHPHMRRTLVETLVTLSERDKKSSIAAMRSVFAELAEELEHSKARRLAEMTEDRERALSPWPLWLDAASGSAVACVLTWPRHDQPDAEQTVIYKGGNEKLQTMLRRAIEAGVLSSTTSPAMLVSAQRCLWTQHAHEDWAVGSTQRPLVELELEWLQRLWRWNLQPGDQEGKTAGMDWSAVTTGPAAALVFNGGVRAVFSKLVDRSQADVGAQEAKELCWLFMALLCGWNAQWHGPSEEFGEHDSGDHAGGLNSAFVARMSSLLDASAIMTRSGLEKLHAELPSHPLDPSALSKAAMRLTSAWSIDARTHSGAEQVMAAARCGYDEQTLQATIAADEVAVRLADTAYVRARSALLERPPELPSYTVAWTRLRQLADGPLSIRSVNALVESLGRAASSQSTSTTEEALAREKTWQASVGNVSGSLALDGSCAHLRDALGEVALGIERVRLGVRFAASQLAATALRNLRSVASSEREPPALLFALFSFLTSTADDASLLLAPPRPWSMDASSAAELLRLATFRLSLQSRCVDLSASKFDALLTCFRRRVERLRRRKQVDSSANRNGAGRSTDDGEMFGERGSGAVQTLYAKHVVAKAELSQHASEELDFLRTFGASHVEEERGTISGAMPESEDKGDEVSLWEPSPECSELWRLFQLFVESQSRARARGEDVSLTELHELHIQAMDCAVKSGSNALFKMPWLCTEQGKHADTILPLTAYAALRASMHANGGQLSLAPSETTTLYNFYVDAVSSQVAVAHRLMRELAAAVQRAATAESELADGNRAGAAAATTAISEELMHPALQRVLSVVRRVANTPLHKPLAAVAMDLELLLRRLDEWNRRMAPSTAKLVDEQRRVAALSASWRARELASWPQLLELRVRRAHAGAVAWFPHLFEVVDGARKREAELTTAEDGADADKNARAAMRPSLAVIDQFLRSSPLGELRARVKLVACFARFVSITCERGANEHRADERTLAASLASLAAFYAQLDEGCDEMLQREKTRLDAQMKEYTTLTRWSVFEDPDANVAKQPSSGDDGKELEFYRLKSAAERHRRQLHRLCRAMDDALSAPTLAVLTETLEHMGLEELRNDKDAGAEAANGQQTSASEEGIDEHNGMIEDDPTLLSTIAASAQELSPWLNQLSSLPRRVRRLTAHQRTILTALGDGATATGELAHELREESLRMSAQPATRALVVVRQRALADTLRALGTAGLPGAGRQTDDAVFSWLASPKLASDDFRGADIDGMFYRCALRAQRLQQLTTKQSRHADVSARDALSMRSYGAELLQLLAAQRRGLHALRSSALSLAEVTQRLDVAAALLDGQHGSGDGRMAGLVDDALAMQNALGDVRCVLAYGDALLPNIWQALEDCKTTRRADAHGASATLQLQLLTAGKRSYAALTAIICELRQWSDSVDESLLLQTSRALIAPERAVEASNRAMSTLREATTRCQRHANETDAGPLAKAFAAAAVAALARATTTRGEQNAVRRASEMAPSPITLPRLLSELGKIVDAVLLGTQKCVVPDGGDDVVEGELEPHYLRLSQRRLESLPSVLRVGEIQRRTLEGIALVKALTVELSADDAKRAALRTLLQRLKLLLRAYDHSVLATAYRAACALHASCTRLLRCVQCKFIDVCTHGFYKPLPDDKSAEDSKSAEEPQSKDTGGTGMADVGGGDASAARDVSDEIESEAQLEGLRDNSGTAPTDEPPEPERSLDRDEGFEMEGDFEGFMEDVKPREDDEQGDEPDDRKEDEPEHRLGVNDASQADIVDERLWNASDDDENEAEDGEGRKKDELQKGKSLDAGGRSADTEIGRREDEDKSAAQRPQQPKAPAADNSAESGPAKVDKDEELQDSGDEGVMEVEQAQMPDRSVRPDELGDANDGDQAEQDIELPDDLRLDGDGEDRGGVDNGDGDDDENRGDAGDKSSDGDGDGDGDEREPDRPEADDDSRSGGENGVAESLAERMPDKGADDFESRELNAASACGLDEDRVGDDGARVDEQDGETGRTEQEEPRSQNNAATTTDDRLGDGGGARSGGGDEGGDRGAAQRRSRLSPPSARRVSQGRERAGVGEDAGEKTEEHEERDEADDKRSGDGGGGDVELSNVDSVAKSSTAQPSPGAAGSSQKVDVEDVDQPHDGSSAAEHELNPSRQLAEPLVENWQRRLQMVREELAAAKDDIQRVDSDEEVADGDGMRHEFSKDGPTSTLAHATEEQQKEQIPALWRKYEPEEHDELNQDTEHIEQSATQRRKQPLQPERLRRLRLGDQDDDEEEAVSRSTETLGLDEQRADGEEGFRPLASRDSAPEIGDDGAWLSRHAPRVDGATTVDEREVATEEVNLAEGDAPSLHDADADALWARLEADSADAAALLCEQLRLLLEPTVATRLAGDYRTGKRLSMRRVVEFVASDFRRDRIWLRRTRPDKRAYDVLLAIDDSASMRDSGAGVMALQGLALLSGALGRLEVGRVAVASFGDQARLLRGFDQTAGGTDAASGSVDANILRQFGFAQKRTDVSAMLRLGLRALDDAKASAPPVAGGAAVLAQLMIIISDGRISEQDAVQTLVRDAITKRQVIAFLLVDSARRGGQSIAHVQKVSFDAAGRVKIASYLDEFPIPFYAVVRDVATLPDVIADVLRQWFELVNADVEN